MLSLHKKITLKYSSPTIVSISRRFFLAITSMSLLLWCAKSVCDLLLWKSERCLSISLKVWMFLNQWASLGKVPVLRNDYGSRMMPGCLTYFLMENENRLSRFRSIWFLVCLCYVIRFLIIINQLQMFKLLRCVL